MWAKCRWIIVKVNLAVHALSTVQCRVANTVTSGWRAILTISVGNKLLSADGNYIVLYCTSFFFSVILKSLHFRFRIRSGPSRVSRPTVWETPTHAMNLHASESREWKWWHCSWGCRGWEAFFVLFTHVPYYQTHDVNLSIFNRSHIVHYRK